MLDTEDGLLGAMILFYQYKCKSETSLLLLHSSMWTMHMMYDLSQKHPEPHTPISNSEPTSHKQRRQHNGFVNVLMRQAEAVNIRPGRTR